MMAETDPDERAQSLAAEAIGAGDPTGWLSLIHI